MYSAQQDLLGSSLQPTSGFLKPRPICQPQSNALLPGGQSLERLHRGPNETFLKGSRGFEKKDSHRQSCFPNGSFPTSQINMALHLLNSYKTSSLSLPICKMGARYYYL